MPSLIFFHSILGLFVEMDSIKQVNSMAAEAAACVTEREKRVKTRKNKSYFGKAVREIALQLTLKLIRPNNLVRGSEDYSEG